LYVFKTKLQQNRNKIKTKTQQNQNKNATKTAVIFHDTVVISLGSSLKLVQFLQYFLTSCTASHSKTTE